jgi:methionyl-tRNA formyltransferase
MRVVTLGSDHPHPLTRATLAVVRQLEGVEHVDHVTANDEREFLRDVRSAEYQSHMASLAPDLLISAAYARIVPDDVLTIPTLGAINVHPSLLPHYRGVQAVWWALYEGCSSVGVTIHQMTAHVDTGPIVAQASLEVTPDTDPVDAWQSLGELVRPLLKQTVEDIRRTGRVTGTPQPAGGSYRSQPHNEIHRLEIDWSQTAAELRRRDRIFRGQANIPALRWRIYARRIEAAGRTDRAPGTILRRRLRTIDVATGESTSVRLVLARPARAWAKLLLLHLATGRIRTLAGTGQHATRLGVSSGTS